MDAYSKLIPGFSYFESVSKQISHILCIFPVSPRSYSTHSYTTPLHRGVSECSTLSHSHHHQWEADDLRCSVQLDLHRFTCTAGCIRDDRHQHQWKHTQFDTLTRASGADGIVKISLSLLLLLLLSFFSLL